MSEILREAAPGRLITAIEENMVAFLPVFGRLGEAQVNDSAGIKRSITHLPLALFNSIMAARLAPEQVAATIRAVTDDARARKVPLLWWTGPSTRPADLGRQLEQNGFVPDDESPGMAVDLAQLNESLPAPEGLSIRLAQGDAAWRQWSRVTALGFEVPPARQELFVDAWHRLMCLADAETTLAFTGWLHGQPVATALLFLAAGVAGIYSVATLPEVRRQGIGAQMTLAALRHARARGYRYGILQSSEMGFKVYRSLGFQEYCKIGMYLFKA